MKQIGGAGPRALLPGAEPQRSKPAQLISRPDKPRAPSQPRREAVTIQVPEFLHFLKSFGVSDAP
jgi:hypothetical protein